MADHSATFEGDDPIPYPVDTAQKSSSIVYDLHTMYIM